jgi:fido (protein-threonine AMPylation protein)
MMIGHHRDKGPGVARPGGIYVRDSSTGEVVYEGPDAELVPGLLDELVAWLNDGDLGVPSYVRAAMAHLNLVKIHPWRDGNGRMSRALQTLVLGRDRITAPEFSSIEEGLSQGQAARDLHELAAKGWLKPYGETKGRFYAPGPRMAEIKAEFAERAAPLRDPYRDGAGDAGGRARS